MALIKIYTNTAREKNPEKNRKELDKKIRTYLGAT